MSSDYIYLQKFVQSIEGYFTLWVTQFDYKTGYRIGAVYTNQSGPLMELYHYFSKNPLEIFFGIGITYSFLHDLDLQATPFGVLDDNGDLLYMFLTSEFYILTYFEQYGIIGTLILTGVYFIYPLLKLLKTLLYDIHSNNIYISTYHYPPQISKIIMIFVGLSIWHIYMKEEKVRRRIYIVEVPLGSIMQYYLNMREIIN